MTHPALDAPRIVACRGDEELLIERTSDGGISFLSDLEIFGRLSAGTKPVVSELKAGGGEDTNAHRLEMIQQLRSGTHLEIVVKRALAYRQPKGKPNRRYLRFADDKLEAGAPSWRGQPFLVDHNTYEQSARKGSILTSEYSADAKGAPAFFMGFAVVKPEAAISVLDGTIDRFSIGWHPTAPVVCSVHGKQIRGKDGCYCWPGDQVDGETVEAIFTGADGVEVSAVNVPAVPEAKGVDLRAALSALAEQSERAVTARKEQDMERIATHLGLGGAATEDQILAALKKLADDKAAAESRLAAEVAAHGLVKGRLAEVEAERLDAETRATAAKVDSVVEGLYRDGKLPIARDTLGVRVPHPLEGSLRDMVAKLGLAAMEQYAASLPKVAPVGSPLQLARDVKRPATADLLSNPDVRKAALAGGNTEADIIKFNGLGVLAPAEGSV